MTTLPFSDTFINLPAAPKYVIERPVGTRPFSLTPDGLCRFRYAAENKKKRVEISPWGSRPLVEAGMRLPLGEQIRFSSVFRLPKEQVFRASKTVVMQWYQTKQRNPPLSLELVGSQWRLVRLWGDASTGNPNRETIWTAPATRGAVVDLFAWLEFSPDWGGQIVWHWNGLRYQFNGPNCYETAEGILPKIGIYKPSAVSTAVPAGEVTIMDFDDWSIE